jgi:hypothetical protein
MLFEHGVERVLRGFDEVAEFAAEFALARGVPDVVGGFDEYLGVLWDVILDSVTIEKRRDYLRHDTSAG